MKKHERTYKLEEKLIASESSDDKMLRAFKRLAEELEAENHALKEWIRAEGERADVCTFNVLGELCGNCACPRRHKSMAPAALNPANAEAIHGEKGATI